MQLGYCLWCAQVCTVIYAYFYIQPHLWLAEQNTSNWMRLNLSSQVCEVEVFDFFRTRSREGVMFRRRWMQADMGNSNEVFYSEHTENFLSWNLGWRNPTQGSKGVKWAQENFETLLHWSSRWGKVLVYFSELHCPGFPKYLRKVQFSPLQLLILRVFKSGFHFHNHILMFTYTVSSHGRQ